MYTKLNVALTQAERQALYEAAQNDVRPLRDQARWCIRRELERRGLLCPGDDQPQSLVDCGQSETRAAL